MCKIYHACLLAFLLCGPRLQAQDPSFSQFYANRVYLNPAFTGVQGGVSVSSIYRNQWWNLDGSFQTGMVSAEIQEPYIRSGFGVTAFFDRAGYMGLNTTGFGASYAYQLLGRRAKSDLRMGLHIRGVRKTIDWSKIDFSDEIDPVYGFVLPTAFVPVVESTAFFDADFGLVWRAERDWRLGKRRLRNVRMSLGASLNHLPAFFGSPADESLQNIGTGVAPRLTLHGGAIIPTYIFEGTGYKLSLSPNVKYDFQYFDRAFPMDENLNVVSVGSYVLFEGLYFGAFYQNKYSVASDWRNTNGWIFLAGAYLGRRVGKRKADDMRYFVGLSYDLNTTGLGTNAGGVFEIAFTANFANAGTFFPKPPRASAKRVLDCESFY